MKLSNILLAAVFLLAITSCRKYETFTNDFDYTAVYFATQKPLRTLVVSDSMDFKVGVALGGVRENNRDESVSFQIDPSLLSTVEGASGFELLPANYYTLSNNNTMVISKGSVIGDITVSLNKELFTSDPNAVNDYYALPLRIVSSTTDSVLSGNASVAAKDYTIVVVKYISSYSGNYYHKGVETRRSTGATTVYSKRDLSANQVWNLKTLSANELTTSGAGTNTSASLRLSLNNNNVTVSTDANLTSASGTGTFNPEKKEYYLSYSYDIEGAVYDVKDTLIQRLPPEQDLRFEEWQPAPELPANILSDYSLFWSDEFEGSSLDLTKWNYRADGAVRNLGTVSRNNSALNGSGQLAIKVTKAADGKYYIGQVGTQGLFETTYGYFECRAKMNTSLGPHVAFWLQSPGYGGLTNPAVDGTEIDIFEFHRKNPVTVFHNLHWNGYGDQHQTLGRTYNYPAVQTGYHTFGLEWTDQEYIFYVDGVETWRTPAALSKRSEFIILSAELTGWGGDPALGTFPDAVYFDYVRVYKKK